MERRPSGKKELRKSAGKRVVNLRRGRIMKAAVKEVRELVGAGKAKEAHAALPGAYKAIDKGVPRVVKKNTAARIKSRLSALVKKAKV